MRQRSGDSATADNDGRGGRVRRLLGWLFSWEDWLTLAIVMIVFLSVVGSINSAEWVDGMPSLFPVAAFGLLLAFFLARTGLPELAAHFLAVILGGVAMLWQVLAVLPEGGFRERSGEMVQRMDAWIDALTLGGISNDNFPFILIVVTLTGLAAYASSWSIFRWRSPWVGLVPGGLALLLNISYLPGQFSCAFVVYLVGAVLLVMRMHFQGRMREWERRGVPYPRYLHFSSLHGALWVSLLLIGAAWLMPPADKTAAFEPLWEPWAQPLANKAAGLSRVFAAVEGKKGPSTHRFEDFLPFRTYLGKGRGTLMTVESSRYGFLRALVYDVYTSSGWEMAEREDQPLDERLDLIARALEQATDARRQTVAVTVTAEVELPVFLAFGEPLAVQDIPAKAEYGGDPSDVTALKPEGTISEGTTYVTTGLVSAASVGVLRRAGDNYPDWVRERYLQLPDDLPETIGKLARDVTAGHDNAYEKARAVEEYLRDYPHEFTSETPPADRDAVEFFLFEQKRGHALYHASAMIVMLRSVGIPSRLAAGFTLRPDDDPTTNIYRVHAADAFAWPEVYFPGLGWIEFSPAPVQPRVARLGEEMSALPAEQPSLEGLLGMEYFDAQREQAPPAPASTPAAVSEGEVSTLWIILGVATGIAVLMGGSTAGLAYAWNRGLSGLSAAERVWEKTLRLAPWAGLRPGATQTPREYIRDLQDRLPEVRDLPFLLHTYERARFGKKPVTPEEGARLETLWAQLRSRLLRRILRRG